MDELSRKIVAIRKNHQCHACLSIFEPPTRMERSTFVDDGIYTLYICETCQSLLREFPDSFLDCDDRFPEGCVFECMSDEDCESPEGLLAKYSTEEYRP